MGRIVLTEEERKERRIASKRKYNATHKEKMREYSRQYYALHADECRERSRRYSKESKVRLRPEVIERKKRWYNENKEHCAQKRKEYYNLHKDEINARQTEYNKGENRKEYLKEWAKKNRKLRDGTPQYIAQYTVSNALSTGKLVRTSECEMCGRGCKVEAHHWSYEPEHRLHVSWLCKKCHGLTRRVKSA